MCGKYSTTPRSRSERKGLFHKDSGSDHNTAMGVEGLLWGVPEHVLSMALWRWTGCCSWYLLAKPEKKAGLQECALLTCPIVQCWEPLPPIPVGHREEVLGWHKCARPGVSPQECAEGVTGPSQEICVRLPSQGWPIHQFTWMLNSPPVLPFAAPGSSSVPCCQS